MTANKGIAIVVARRLLGKPIFSRGDIVEMTRRGHTAAWITMHGYGTISDDSIDGGYWVNFSNGHRHWCPGDRLRLIHTEDML